LAIVPTELNGFISELRRFISGVFAAVATFDLMALAKTRSSFFAVIFVFSAGFLLVPSDDEGVAVLATLSSGSSVTPGGSVPK